MQDRWMRRLARLAREQRDEALPRELARPLDAIELDVIARTIAARLDVPPVSSRRE